jgi:hypothetical protein
MSNIDRIIENVNATMSMENMPLLDSDKERIRECLEGQIDFEEAIKILINKHMHKQVV